MPATEETYRSQPTLHVVFAISSIAMTLVIVWMIMADHLRPWKTVQREFHRIEQAKLRANEKEKLQEQKSKYQAQLDELDAQIAKADQAQYDNAPKLRVLNAELEKVGGRFEKLDTAKKFQKAELDSQRSLYDGMIERDETREARVYRDTVIVESERKLEELSKDFEAVETELKALNAEKEALLGNVDDLKKKREALTRDVDRVQRTITQKQEQHFGFLAWVRSLPGIDLTPPNKIQQISLPDLTINYNFKDVPRYDRCTTCHQGIDRLGYETDANGEPMPPPYASHPHLTDGATALDPRGNLVKAGLYLDGNGPHPINSFGCTICHGGQGSGTDFSFASHTPNDLEQKHDWEHGKNQWREIHHWDEPMLPKRFMESSCLKCHHEVTDVPQASKLQAGFERITKYGCTGCHTIGGDGAFGPDLTDERAVGPNLGHLGSKVSREWTLKWIKNPHAFRPDSRMPRFYGVSNNDAPADQPKNHAEIHAITHYLFATSKPPAEFVEPPAKGDPAKGKELFLQKGCLACHAHRPYEKGEIQAADRGMINPAYQPDPAATFDPNGFPETARKYAKADYGPNLSNIAAKFKSHGEGYKWLANWIKSPEAYHPKSLMPNLQLSMEDAANIASWILSVPGEWPVQVEVPPVDSNEVKQGIDELVTLYVTKGGFKRQGKLESVPLSEVGSFVKGLSQEDKLMFLGEKTISRLGCFGCHNINGFETAKPIGTPLNGWGTKSPAKLDYAHINEYLVAQKLDEAGARDGTDEYYQEQLGHQTRAGFLYQKLHRPRSYDFAKTNEDIKAWDDRLRMPQFAWANDPAAVEEVMTFVLGLTGEKIASKYLPKSHYSPAQVAVAQGTKLLSRYNCTGCHVVEMPKYTVAAGKPLEEAFPDLATNVRVAYNGRANDFLKEFAPALTFDSKQPPPELKPYDNQGVTIEGMPVGVFEDELTVQLWKPVTIRGFTFQVGDNLTLDKTKIAVTEPEGGNFAWLFAGYQAEKTGSDFASFWNRLPPPLLREGQKVQTPWLTSFLNDPYAIRPAVNLRMPKFHFGKSNDLTAKETAGLANFFAARDQAEFPYQTIPQREQSYLAGLEAKHPDYLAGGWDLMAKGACIQCHSLGQFKPTGGAEVVNGPDLRQVAARFRPDYLAQWIANPKRLLPFTAMPQNVPPHGPPPPFVPKSFEDQPSAMVTAIRDTLLNYVNAVEQQLAKNAKPGAAPPAQAARPKPTE